MTTVETRPPLIGEGIDRVDAPLKVTGTANYPNDFSYPGMVHAALVGSTIAAGRIRSIDASGAQAAPGVLTVITYLTAPHLERGPMTLLGPSVPAPMQDDRILHYGQHVAVVVADTPEQARHAASLVRIDYEPAAEALLDTEDPRAQIVEDPWDMDHERGDVEAGFAQADVVIDERYTTPDNTNNPLGLMGTIAAWHGDSVTIHDSTQWPHNVRTSIAQIFGIPESGIRVLVPFIGGGFGAGLRVWSHTILTVLAAREIRRPVKLVLTRPQMFTSVGHRPDSVQQIKIGVTRDGDLTAIEHLSISSLTMDDDDYEPVASGTAVAYACPNARTRDRQARLNIPCPGSMRAPAEAQGNWALESAIDEAAHAIGMDPLAFRLHNFAEVHPVLNLPWSSNALRECYTLGAERFGWSMRTPEIGSMRDGRWLIGWGMAAGAFPFFQAPCQARASLRHDGSAYVRSAAADLGTGTYTVMTQLAAELLGLEIGKVRFDLGDSDMPYAPMAGGSGLTGALSGAVKIACTKLIQEFLDVVRDDDASPLRGAGPDDVTVGEGRLFLIDSPDQGETFVDILARHGLEELSADGRNTPPVAEKIRMAPAGAFGAKFVEVRIDPQLGLLRVARVVTAIDGGRILNEKTARSQIIGGTVGGISQGLFEETATDAGTGRIANATFADYLMPVNADIPDIEVIFCGEPDRASKVGTKGVGEVGLVGLAAAVGNAIHHATGRRLRSLPLTIEQLML
ncbi:xanthine dehydrogenase family protein molybdopterin-binding subunit [Streptomyces sp. NPDC047706]|uniref:xanthine dehydrogenase family protein molybdopterin-binding subunit n=1 Tax=Streptomyces sp. NPDC047706 TaxID=3365486 RepID=UPI00370FE1B8